MSDGDACGYCSLLAHMPAVPSVEALFVVTVRALQHTVATRFESVRRVEPLTFAQPRAPPFVILIRVTTARCIACIAAAAARSSDRARRHCHDP